MRAPPLPLIGLLQAAGIIAYVLSLVFFVWNLDGMDVEPQMPFPPLLFLLTFCFSALVCGAIALGYPLMLISQKRIKDALMVILWTIGWMGVALALLAAYVLSIGPAASL